MRRFPRYLRGKAIPKVGSPRRISHPGVYVAEVAASFKPIQEAPTAIAAFIGRAKTGPLDEPVPLRSFGEFENRFGGLWTESHLGYSVRDFFLNGGSEAVVVRLAEEASPAGITLPIHGNAPASLKLLARHPGSWGRKLKVTVNTLAIGAADINQFNLLVEYTEDGRMEVHLRLSADPASPRFFGTILQERSALLVAETTPDGGIAAPPSRPASGTYPADPASGSDGTDLSLDSFTGPGKQQAREGLYALEKADAFNLLVLPPYTHADGVNSALLEEAAVFCEKHLAFLIIDPPPKWNQTSAAVSGIGNLGTQSVNAAVYFPRVVQADPLQGSLAVSRAPSGGIAGVYARTDAERGVWKAPAGMGAGLRGIQGPSLNLDHNALGQLNTRHVNPIWTSPQAGTVLYGSRTVGGGLPHQAEWRYIPVRRLALFLEKSIREGTRWAAFEPNQSSTWQSLKQSVENFLSQLWRQGAFAGGSAKEAYFVKCGLGETMTQLDIDQGRLRYQVGFAPLKPAEFVVLNFTNKQDSP